MQKEKKLVFSQHWNKKNYLVKLFAQNMQTKDICNRNTF
nr:MAG TPA: hypothetical protein [Caudoviricetes sp.]DAN34917.1 MAG TPA: hypothetical protein [Caudoviricetes sp.]